MVHETAAEVIRVCADGKRLLFRPVAFSPFRLEASVEFGELFLVFLLFLLVPLRARLVVEPPQLCFFCVAIGQLRMMYSRHRNYVFGSVQYTGAVEKTSGFLLGGLEPSSPRPLHGFICAPRS